jgi:ABC-type uncharacterized transport system substrate-binding protein
MASSRFLTVMAACVFLAALSGCHVPGRQKLFYVDSYHPGDAASDAIVAGIYEVVADSKARLDVFFMDAQRYPQAESIAKKVEEVLATIRDIRPDVIIASGNTAVEFVLAEHFKDGPIPGVFCAVNWTCEPYGLPTENATGILEIPPVRETLAVLKQHSPDGKRVAVLSGDSSSQPRNEEALDAIFFECGLTATHVSAKTPDEWKAQFAKANAEADMIFLTTNQGIENWDEADVKAFVGEHIRVPVVTCDASMMKVAVFGLSAAGREQGQWAAKTALRILRGESPAKIPVVRTDQATAYINTTLADRVGFKPDEALLNRCRRVE